MVIREVETGLRQDTLPPITQIGMVYGHVALLPHVLLMNVFMVVRGVI